MNKLALAIALGAAFTCLVATADTRVWKDKSGQHQVKAELVEVRDDHVVLKTEAGKQVTVPLDRLSPADLEYAQSKRPADVPAGSSQRSDFKVECLGLRVRKSVPVVKKAADDMEAIMFSGSFEGTEVEFLITADKQLVSVNESACKLERLDDNLGNALLKSGRRGFGFFFGRIRPDGRAAIVTIRAANTPAPGATKLAVKGTFVLRCGKEETTVESDLIDLKTGGKVKVGETTVTVKEGKFPGGFGPPNAGSGEEATVVTLEGSGRFDSIKSVSFHGPDGSSIAMEDSWGTTGGQGYSMSYSLKRKSPKVKVTMVYFAKIEDTPIPVAMEVGLGF